jgi:SAM-dependent methyltransferase
MNTLLYFIEGEIIAQCGNIKVYEFNGELYLERGPGHSLWADSLEIEELKPQIGDKPRGDCLEIGLGLGVASKFILSKDINSLTTVEKDIEVITVYKQLNPIDDKHKIICGNGADFMLETKGTYDFIFLDFYDIIDEDTIGDIENYVKIAKTILRPGGEVVGWFDIYTPDEFAEQFFALFGQEELWHAKKLEETTNYQGPKLEL